MTLTSEIENVGASWADQNELCLNLELQRLRLLLQRRVLWLRQLWRHDPLENFQGLVITEAQADWSLAGEDHQAEQKFYKEDDRAIALSTSIASLDHELSERSQALAAAHTPPAIDRLVALFGLTTFERNALLLCLAPELDPSFAQLYAYVQDDVARRFATIHLALTLYRNHGAPVETQRDAFLPGACFRHFKLIEMHPRSTPAESQSYRALYLDDRMVDYLRGINRLDERASNLLTSLVGIPTTPAHELLIDRLQTLIQPNTGHRALNFIGPTGSGKQAVATRLCERFGIRLSKLEISRLPPAGTYERQNMFRLLEREALLLQMFIYLDTSDCNLADKASVDSFTEVVEGLHVVLIVGSTNRWQSERELHPIQIPVPESEGRRAIWKRLLAGSRISETQLEALVQQFDFGPTMISKAVTTAGVRAQVLAGDGNGEVRFDDLWQACREQAGWHLDELAQHITSNYTWNDMVLPEDALRHLREIASQVETRHLVYETWGFGELLSRGRGISALFSGPSGTGKTMAAEILANHLKLDLYRIDLAGVVSKYIGETEKNLRRLFDAAEHSGAILFFDEADALFGKRSEVKDSHDRYANIEINYLLQRMEDYRGLAILATNRKSALDRAFMRRLRFLVDFPFPNADDRRAIWQKVFPKQTPLTALDFDVLSRLELPGGNIRNIALNATFLAAGEGQSVSMAHLAHAARREYSKIDKLLTEAEWIFNDKKII
jgi:SpoVK/Ycf46/Vps4 family AAA+-type ATPase